MRTACEETASERHLIPDRNGDHRLINAERKLLRKKMWGQFPPALCRAFRNRPLNTEL